MAIATNEAPNETRTLCPTEDPPDLLLRWQIDRASDLCENPKTFITSPPFTTPCGDTWRILSNLKGLMSMSAQPVCELVYESGQPRIVSRYLVCVLTPYTSSFFENTTKPLLIAEGGEILCDRFHSAVRGGTNPDRLTIEVRLWMRLAACDLKAECDRLLAGCDRVLAGCDSLSAGCDSLSAACDHSLALRDLYLAGNDRLLAECERAKAAMEEMHQNSQSILEIMKQEMEERHQNSQSILEIMKQEMEERHQNSQSILEIVELRRINRNCSLLITLVLVVLLMLVAFAVRLSESS